MRLACWFRRHAETIFLETRFSAHAWSWEKFAMARHHLQHARRVALPRTYGFNPWEQRHRLADDMSVRQSAPLRVFEREAFFFSAQFHFPIQLVENAVRRFWQNGRNQNCDDAK